MQTYTDSLRGYAADILARDGCRCRYCDLDGTVSFSNWLALSEDHLLRKGHPDRDKVEFIAASCKFCNTAANRYFEQATARGESFEGLTPDDLVARRQLKVQKARDAYRHFWDENVAPKCRGWKRANAE